MLHKDGLCYLNIQFGKIEYLHGVWLIETHKINFKHIHSISCHWDLSFWYKLHGPFEMGYNGMDMWAHKKH